MTGFGDDDTARNIHNQRQADARPTDDELASAQEKAEARKTLIKTLVERGVEEGLIERVTVDPQYGLPTLQPNSLDEVAAQLDLAEEYEKHLADCDRSFIAPGVTGTAESLGVPVEELDRPDRR